MVGTVGSVPSILVRLPPAQTKHLVLENSARDRSIVTIRLSILDVSAKLDGVNCADSVRNGVFVMLFFNVSENG